MSKKDSCLIAPLVGTEPSRMYKDFLEKEKLSRPMANMLYAMYTVNNLATAMENAVDQNGVKLYHKNRQGEFNAKDVIDFLGLRDELRLSLMEEEFNLGATQSRGGARVDFTNAEDALLKAQDFNNTHKSMVATVIKYEKDDGSSVYNILVNEKGSRTLNFTSDVDERLEAWNVLQHAFNGVGIDFTNIPQLLQGTLSAYNPYLAQYIQNLTRYTINNLHEKEALMLFYLNRNSQDVQNLINSFGSIEVAAKSLSDYNNRLISLTAPQTRLLARAVSSARNLNGLDLNALVTQINNTTQNVRTNNLDLQYKAEVHKLNKKFHIDKDEIITKGREIKTLSDGVARASLTLKRQIDELKKDKGNIVTTRRKEHILEGLLKELAAKRYYAGILSFFQEANTDLSKVEDLIQDINNVTGTEIEKAFKRATLFQEIRRLRDQYYDIVSALANENITIDESISQTDIDNIRSQARALKEMYDKETSEGKSKLDDLIKDNMISLISAIMGEAAPDRRVVEEMIDMGLKDANLLDHYVYTMGRASNTLINATGNIIQTAQMERDAVMNDVSRRIARANEKLKKAGHTSEFMYEGDLYIVSDINWGKYQAARNAKMSSLYRRGLSPETLDFKLEMDTWEEANTEERVVDITNGRTERVPNSNYRKSGSPTSFMNGWTQAQKDYYNEMMQIKGELGSLLPAFAQMQYRAPQLRRNFLDAVSDGDVGKAAKNKIKDLWTIREDDETYANKGILNGEEYSFVSGNFDDSERKQIPIFYINEVEGGELLKDFSTGLTALAKTAINYSAMDNIVDVVEFIRDFAQDQQAPDAENKAEVVENRLIRTIQNIYKVGKRSNVADVLTEGIAFQVYGSKRVAGEENSKLAKFLDSIIAYTSFKGLSTNAPGAMANALMGELQMLIEAGAGEFYGFKDYAWAHTKLLGEGGVGGELMELLTNNINHKGVLMRELFDPMQENFSEKGNKRYYNSMFRQLLSHDCSFIGYSSGEYLLHYINMYAVLNNTKVKLNGKTINLYDAFEVTNKIDGNSEIQLKNGVTDLNGNAITDEFLNKVRRDIRYVNQTTHGAMNAEDKGLLTRRWYGRAAINFRQWMIEHYSRRFRGRHFDSSIKNFREGYWVTMYKALFNDDTKETWQYDSKFGAMWMFAKDLFKFTLRSSAQWNNLTDDQKSNISRAKSEFAIFLSLCGLSFALGEPDKHKKEFWRRWWIYQTRRMLLETESSMPHPKNFSNWLTVMNSPMASINTLNSLLYVFYGLTNGDLWTEIKSGDHKGEIKYWRNIKKYTLPFYKDFEKMQKFDDDDSLFKVFEASPSNR